MPRYLTLVRIDESMPFGPPPQALFDAMGKQMEQDTADGTLVDAQGLAPSSSGALATLADGKITVIDGPFSEAKEVVGGWSIFQVRSKDEAVEKAREFLQMHADHWPGCSLSVEIRELMDEPPTFEWSGGHADTMMRW
jgi:hypothetical protein